MTVSRFVEYTVLLIILCSVKFKVQVVVVYYQQVAYLFVYGWWQNLLYWSSRPANYSRPLND